MATILTDIEGTTSSISFVKQVLFPFARRALPGFVRARGNEPEVRRWLDAVAVEHGSICSDETIVETLQGWIDEDRKHTALKALQGMVWRQGYLSGELQADIYPDAAAGLRRWHEAGHRLAVYSSGSVAAQQLLFAHTDAGDLTPLFDAFFDTEVGHKREPGSYTTIAAKLKRRPPFTTAAHRLILTMFSASSPSMRSLRSPRSPRCPPPRWPLPRSPPPRSLR